MRKLMILALCAAYSSCATAPKKTVFVHRPSWLEEVKADNARVEADTARMEASNARAQAEENARVQANNARLQVETDKRRVAEAAMETLRREDPDKWITEHNRMVIENTYAAPSQAPSQEAQSSEVAFETRELANQVRELKEEVVNASLRNN